MKLLTSFSVTCIEGISLVGRKELILQLLTDDDRLTVEFSGVVYLSLSNDVLDMEDGEISVVEICHEYRELDKSDLNIYSFELNESHDQNCKFHVLQIWGSSVIGIICKNISIQ